MWWSSFCRRVLGADSRPFFRRLAGSGHKSSLNGQLWSYQKACTRCEVVCQLLRMREHPRRRNEMG